MGTKEPSEVVSRPKTIDWFALDYRLPDVRLAALTGLTRERIRQVRARLLMASSVNWSRQDHELVSETRLPLSWIQTLREHRHWLLENTKYFTPGRRQSIPRECGKSVIQAMDTTFMTREEIAVKAGCRPSTVRQHLRELQKPHLFTNRQGQNRRRWNWSVVQTDEFRNLTDKQIAQIVLDPDGNHPTEEVVYQKRVRLEQAHRAKTGEIGRYMKARRIPHPFYPESAAAA